VSGLVRRSGNGRLQALGFGLPNRRSVFRVLAAMALLTLSTGVHGRGTPSHASTHPSKTRSVIYTGEVNARSAKRFYHLVAGYEDRNITLDVLVKPDVPGEFEKWGYMADCYRGQLGISITRKGAGGGAVVHNGPCRSIGGRFPISGEFFVVGGGMHQGIVSLALMPPRRGKPHSVDRREKPRVRF